MKQELVYKTSLSEEKRFYGYDGTGPNDLGMLYISVKGGSLGGHHELVQARYIWEETAVFPPKEGEEIAKYGEETQEGLSKSLADSLLENSLGLAHEAKVVRRRRDLVVMIKKLRVTPLQGEMREISEIEMSTTCMCNPKESRPKDMPDWMKIHNGIDIEKDIVYCLACRGIISNTA